MSAIAKSGGLHKMLSETEYASHFDSDEWAEAILGNYEPGLVSIA